MQQKVPKRILPSDMQEILRIEAMKINMLSSICGRGTIDGVKDNELWEVHMEHKRPCDDHFEQMKRKVVKIIFTGKADRARRNILYYKRWWETPCTSEDSKYSKTKKLTIIQQE